MISDLYQDTLHWLFGNALGNRLHYLARFSLEETARAIEEFLGKAASYKDVSSTVTLNADEYTICV